MSLCELIPIPFAGHQITVARDTSGEGWLSIADPCRRLGIDMTAQVGFIKRRFAQQYWREVSIGEDVMVLLSRRRVAAWLYAIPENACRPECRDALRTYQEHCDEVLAQHFEGTRSVPVASGPPPRKAPRRGHRHLKTPCRHPWLR